MYPGLGKEWIMISLDKVVFGWAVRVAVVQLSPGLMWTTSILFCMYLLCVLRHIGWIDKANWFIRYVLYGLILQHARSAKSNPHSSVPHHVVQFASRLYIWYTLQTNVTCVTLGTPLSPYSKMVQQ
jgi:hypothetical protein